MRIAIAALCSCVLVSLGVLANPAKAGDYYGDGYRHRHSDNVWYSSDCCYKKIVRHERSVRYSRIQDERRYERHGYYDRPYRPSYTYDSPRRYDYSYTPRRSVYDGYNGYNGYNGYSGYAGIAYSSHADSCYRRRVPIEDGRGGWVWGVKANCY